MADAQALVDSAEAERLERTNAGLWDGMYHLSVFGAPPETDETEEDVVSRIFRGQRDVKIYRRMSMTKLSEEGFSLVASSPEPYHYDARVGPTMSIEIAERFIACFEPAKKHSKWVRVK